MTAIKSTKGRKAAPKVEARPEPRAAYAPELAAAFCAAIAEGDKAIADICKLKGMPSKATVFRWKASIPEFREMYEAAKDMQIELHIDECASIADQCAVDKDAIAKARLRIDTRMERAQLLRPKTYSKKVTQELVGAGGGAIQVRTAAALTDDELAAIAAGAKCS